MKVSDMMKRPPGPFRAGFWKSASRGRRVTAALGLILLPMLTIVIVTGLLSYAAYNPRLPGNDNVRHAGFLHFYLFDWPVSPSWLYRLNQGLHVTIGVALVPIVLIKLWSVLPKLFEWPPVRSPAHLLERISLLALVGGILFELVTGLLNISNDYVFGFSFYTAHLYGAIVFIAGFVVHVSLKLRLAYRSVRRRERPADGPDELAASAPGPQHHQPPRGHHAGRRILSRRGCAVRGPNHRRPLAQDRIARTSRWPGQPVLSDQPNGPDRSSLAGRR